MARYIPGGRVVLADGTYEFGGPVSLNRQKAHLQGVGGATHIRPSTTGFTELINIDDIHTRVGYMLLLDSGDDQYDLTYALSENTQSWTILESIHTHGAGLIFRGSLGFSVEQFEFHGTTALGGGDVSPWAIYVFEDADGFSADFGRVHGGYIEAADRNSILLYNANKCTVEGVHCYRASLENTDSYEMVYLRNATQRCSIMGNHFDGAGEARWVLYETSDGFDNSVLGNRIVEGATGDLSLNGSGSLSAANFTRNGIE